MLKYTHIIWDFDNTICHTIPAMAQATQTVLLEMGINGIGVDRLEQIISVSLSSGSKILAAEYGFDADDLMARFPDVYHAMPIETQPLYPGVRNALAWFNEQRGKHYLFTHRSRETMLQFFDVYDLGNYFGEAISVTDGFARKPDPAGFTYLIEKHNLPTTQTLAIGDRELDIIAASAAGLATCLYGSTPMKTAQPTHHIMDYTRAFQVMVGF